MSDQRYSLEHTGRRGAGETRGGLSLLVRDDWSGESRDPATLSGGETFVVSLALALGLADVVTQEAGGADLDTLFVDEGFGSLDADTLDDVMDTLDSLRDGGRVVGVVSHVGRDARPDPHPAARCRKSPPRVDPARSAAERSDVDLTVVRVVGVAGQLGLREAQQRGDLPARGVPVLPALDVDPEQGRVRVVRARRAARPRRRCSTARRSFSVSSTTSARP